MRHDCALQALATAAALAASGAAHAQSNIDLTADLRPVTELLERLSAPGRAALPRSGVELPLFSGELASARLQEPLPPPDVVIMLTGGKAVARLASNADRPDIYLYLDRAPAGTWTVSATRGLALTGVLAELQRLLRAKPSLTAEEQTHQRNVDLTLSSDNALKLWFVTHRARLEGLRQAVAAQGATGGIASRDDTPDGRQLVTLGSTAVTRGDGIEHVIIGGMVDNEVGFLHAPAGKVPAIDRCSYIWIEPLGGDWYLYKTT